MRKRTGLLFVLFVILCFCVICAGIIAIRYSQGSATDGEWVFIVLLSAASVFDLLAIRSIYYAA